MTRQVYAKLAVAMLAIGTLISVVMLQFEWNGLNASVERDQIDVLLDVMIVLSSYVFAIVGVMFGYALWKFRAKPGDESDGEAIHGNTRLEIAWTVIPTVIVLFGAVYSWIVLDDIEARADDRMVVNVTAQQFKWTFEYPEEGVTSDELHVPVDQQLELHLTALDVLHSFWVPEWGIKRDLVPLGEGGDEVDDEVVVTPDLEGSYTVLCTEYCGTGHSTMRAFAEVQSQEEFDQWVAEERKAGGGDGADSGGTTEGGSGP